MWFLFVVSLVGFASAGFSAVPLLQSCYSNGTIEVTHPGSYSHVFAVQDEGLPIAVICTVATNGLVSLITGCSQDKKIVVFFSDRTGSVETFGSNSDYISYEIECGDLPLAGVDRTVSNLLGVTLEVTTQDAVTPSFTISSALRQPDQLGPPVYAEYVGEEVYWTIDIPSDYSASPTCYAYSGTSDVGTPSKLLVKDGCREDFDLLAGDFDNIETSIPFIKRYYVKLYVFQFYNSDNVLFKCTVKVCPSGSSACEIICSKRKRSVEAVKPEMHNEKMFTTSNVMHIIPYSENGGGSVLGSLWLCLATVIYTFYK